MQNKKNKNKNQLNICILCMSCNDQIFKYQEDVCRNTWIKQGKKLGIDIYIYTGSDKDYIEDDIIYCNCLDDLEHTFEKTIKAISQIDYLKYDYILRTNLTTYVNCDLLIKYCKYLKENNYEIACGDIMLQDNFYIYRGNSLLLAPNVWKFIIDNPSHENLHDDLAISEILKNYRHTPHYSSLRYYIDKHRINHPYSIDSYDKLKENIEGIIYISYRINGDEYDRFNELASGYYIDSIVKKLDNNDIKSNHYLFNYDTGQFLKI